MTRDISEQFGLNYLLKEAPKVEGLTLRDFFAAFALAGLATTLLEADAPAAGRIAYTFADAALRARGEVK